MDDNKQGYVNGFEAGYIAGRRSAANVTTAHWNVCEDPYCICATEFTCSNCNETFCSSEIDDREYLAMMKYCPNCGAKMTDGGVVE